MPVHAHKASRYLAFDRCVSQGRAARGAAAQRPRKNTHHQRALPGRPTAERGPPSTQGRRGGGGQCGGRPAQHVACGQAWRACVCVEEEREGGHAPSLSTPQREKREMKRKTDGSMPHPPARGGRARAGRRSVLTQMKEHTHPTRPVENGPPRGARPVVGGGGRHRHVCVFLKKGEGLGQEDPRAPLPLPHTQPPRPTHAPRALCPGSACCLATH
jgi:hypothetical protein